MSKKNWDSAAIGSALVKTLGLPANTAWVEVRLAVGEPLSVKCGYYLDKIAAKNGVEFCEKLKVIELREVDTTAV